MPLLPALLLSTLLQAPNLDARLQAIEKDSKGKLGVAIVTPKSSHYLHKGERFSLQSVMKLMVAMAALDKVDKGQWPRNKTFTFRRSDLSLSYQPILDRLGKKDQIQIKLTDCIELMVGQSCSGAGDFVIRQMGGTQVINAFLKKSGIQGMSVDRQERDLQTAIGGLTWKPQYVDEQKLEADFAKVPAATQDLAYQRYLNDARDTTTPEAMAVLLKKLLQGKLLSPTSTKYLLGVMERTETGPDRLKAGVPAGWTLAHKTGTSSTHRGVAGATNDVGIARSKSGDWVILVALLKASTLEPDDRSNILCRVAKSAFEAR